MTGSEIRNTFLQFFKERRHTIVQSSSLIPDDPSVLLTTAGMQQFKKYYTGTADAMKDFGSLSTVSVQKSFRTSDIDEVGDVTHHTFFEMLGNFSFGGYFKREAITFAHEFLTKTLGLPISYVTVFAGSHGVEKDTESRDIWNSLGVTDVREEGVADVFWGPTGSAGPCGPTTEIYCKNARGEDVEVWNIVFNEFFYPASRDELLSGSDKKLVRLNTPGVDTGMGLERLCMIVQGAETNFDTDLFAPLMEQIPEMFDVRTRRMIADHVRACAFLIADGVRPSNKERGYVLRRLMRRVITHEYRASESGFDAIQLFDLLISLYGAFYPELQLHTLNEVWILEKEKFLRTLRAGLKELEKMPSIDDAAAFKLYESFGLPYEVIKEVGGERSFTLTREGFEKEFLHHQEISRAGAEKKFGGHGLLLNTGELKARDERELSIVTRLHTATHLLHAALRKVLGDDVHQEGSDITAERTRFDFTLSRKMTDDEISLVEDVVNEVIKKDLRVSVHEYTLEDALKTGALSFFREKYPERVTMYVVGESLDTAFSKELCGGPHVAHTNEIGPIKIMKEEASSAGVRRIRAVLANP